MPSKRRNLLAASGAGGDSLYVEDVFSTFLYTGNGAIRTITNGLDLDGEGGMVWIKNRTTAAENPVWDSTRSYTEGVIRTNASNSLYTSVTDMWTGFTASGFTLGADTNLGWVNTNADNYVSWTFRKAEKFFDVVEYTGNGTAGRTVAHNLGSVPAMMIVKRLDSSASWGTYHKDLTSAAYSLIVNEAGGEVSFPSLWNSTAPTDTVFTVGDNSSPPNSARTNSNGGNFVAYLFASDAGGFGDDGAENIIKCGTWTENGANNITIDCGFEPEFVMFKCIGGASSWYMVDSMRGIPTPSSGTATGNYINTVLQANATTAETSANAISLTSTGFIWYADGRITNTAKWVYIAVRMPMKTPEAGTEVFSPYAYQDATLTSGSGTATNRTILNGGVNGGTNFAVDMFMGVNRTGSASYGLTVFDRLRGKGRGLLTNTEGSEPAGDSASNGGFAFQEGVDVEYNGQFYYYTSGAGNRTHIGYFLKRAAGFFDVVAYTGDGATSRAVPHNLKVTPELIINKNRSAVSEWRVWSTTPGDSAQGYLQRDFAFAGGGYIENVTSSAFGVTGYSNSTNVASNTYITYLFATVSGVSKVGSYTGTAATLNVDCGFTAGTRFVLIKRTDSTGDWYYWDSARGIVAGNDPYLLVNVAATEVTNTDYVDSLNAGFTVTSTAPAALNASGGTYIFLAIA
jgi:hypothetical protein